MQDLLELEMVEVEDLAQLPLDTVTGRQHWVDGRQHWVEGRQHWVDGEQHWVDSGQHWVDGGQHWIDSGQQWLDGLILLNLKSYFDGLIDQLFPPGEAPARLLANSGSLSGGYSDHVFRAAASQLFGAALDNIQYTTVKNMDFKEEHRSRS